MGKNSFWKPLVLVGVILFFAGCLEEPARVVSWNSITSYPSPCSGGDGNVLQGVGDDLNCVQVVKQLVAGSGISLSPVSGLGIVTIASLGGGSGGGSYSSGSPATIQVNNDLNTISQNFDGNWHSFFPSSFDGNFDASTYGSADFNAVYKNEGGSGDLNWAELNTVVPWADVNVSDSLTVDWSGLQNYPAGCGAGEAVQVIGDTLTCIAVGGGSGLVPAYNVTSDGNATFGAGDYIFPSQLGVGITPISILHSYQNDTTTSTTNGLTIEQDGTGDAQAQFLLTGGQRWVAGIDNSDADKFKIGRGAAWSTAADIIINQTNGFVGIGEYTNIVAQLHVTSPTNGLVAIFQKNDTQTALNSVSSTFIMRNNDTTNSNYGCFSFNSIYGVSTAATAARWCARFYDRSAGGISGDLIAVTREGGTLPSEVGRFTANKRFVMGAGVTAAAKVHIQGEGTTTTKALLIENSSGTDKFFVQDNGLVDISGNIVYDNAGEADTNSAGYATITFTTAQADANYSVVLTPILNDGESLTANEACYSQYRSAADFQVYCAADGSPPTPAQRRFSWMVIDNG